MPSFSPILDEPSSATERPKPLAVGTYECMVKSRKYDKSSKKQTDYVEFGLTPMAPLDDVDQEALTECLSRIDGSTRRLQDFSIRATFYLTEDAKWRLKKFLEDCGLETNGEATYGQLIENALNCSVLASIKHRSSEDGEAIFAELAKTAPVGE